MHAFPRARVGAVVLVCTVGLSAALFAMAARPQGVTATAKISPASDPVAVIKRRIDELERRVLELEKEKADQAEADEGEDVADKKLEQRLVAADKRLEQRIASIESAQRYEKVQEKTPATSSTTKMPSPQKAASQSFRAPFTVFDDKGTILTVMRGTKGGARMVLGNPRAAQLNLIVSSAGESSVQWVDANATVRMNASASASKALLHTRGKEGYVLVGHSEDGIPLLQILNPGQIPVAELRGMLSHSGQLQIFDRDGVLMVAAGVASKGVGVVKTGPNGFGPAAMLGNAGLPASEIGGTKK